MTNSVYEIIRTILNSLEGLVLATTLYNNVFSIYHIHLPDVRIFFRKFVFLISPTKILLFCSVYCFLSKNRNLTCIHDVIDLTI